MTDWITTLGLDRQETTCHEQGQRSQEPEGEMFSSFALDLCAAIARSSCVSLRHTLHAGSKTAENKRFVPKRSYCSDCLEGDVYL